MSTGDLTNNVKKLKAKLRIIKYTEDIDISGLTEGNAKVYLPIYHYAFTQYSPALAAVILEKDIELFGKSDSRFMEAIYKILRDIFSYRPPVTKDKFFSRGFAERKVIMCTEVLQNVISKNAALNPAAAKTAMKTSVRPASAADSRNLPMAVPKTKRPGSAKPSSRPQTGSNQVEAVPRPPPHVINELTSEPASPPVRHTAQLMSRAAITRHIARSPDDVHSASSDIRPTRQVTIQSPREEEKYSREDSSWEDSPRNKQYNYYPETPSINRACPKLVEVVSMPRVEEVYDQSAIEIRAATSESILNSTAPSSDSDVQTQITNLYQSMEMITEQVMRVDSTMREWQSNTGVTDPYIKGLEQKIQSQLDNLMARMVLLENRTAILEAKVDDHCQTCTIPGPASGQETFLPSTATPPSFSEDLQSVSAVHKFQQVLKEHSDVSLIYSPIRKTTNSVEGQLMSANEDTFAQETEDDARRSSTPTMGMGRSLLGESSICCNFSDPDTNDAVSRIKNMMKETKTILNDQKLNTEIGPAT